MLVGVWDRVWDRVQGKAPPGAKRHGSWRRVRREHLLRHPRCEVCGGTRKLTVHHEVPFHLAPALELNPENLLTLCEAGKYGIVCHQLIGHKGDYRRVNPGVRGDAAYWREKLRR